MGKSMFPAILTLVAGFCLGLLCNFGFLAPGVTALQPAVTPISPLKSPLPTPSQTAFTSPSPTVSPTLDMTDNTLLLEVASDVIAALQDQDYDALGTLTHPVKGVVFTPYSTVDLDANLTFAGSQLASLLKSDKTYVWGTTDGKGEPLEMTMSEYHTRYLYNADFANAPMLGIDQILGSGNALENVKEVFPQGRFVEYFFPGLNPEHNGFDWCGLKLVFEVHDNQFYLVALIHSEWTV